MSGHDKDEMMVHPMDRLAIPRGHDVRATPSLSGVPR
jgi:hypothetical protein